MPRKKGSRNKVKEEKVKKIEPAAIPITQPEEQPEIVATPEEKPEIKEDTGPAEEKYISTDEAARLLGVDEKCAQLWFDHGHLTGTNNLGHIRISRKSIFSDRVQMLAGKSKDKR